MGIRARLLVVLLLGLALLDSGECRDERGPNDPGHGGGGDRDRDGGGRDGDRDGHGRFSGGVGGGRRGHLHSRNYRGKRTDVISAIRQRGRRWEAEVNPDFENLGVEDFGSLLGGVPVDTANVTATVQRPAPHGRKFPGRHGDGGPGGRGPQSGGPTAGGNGPPAGGNGPPTGGHGPPAGGDGPPRGRDSPPSGGSNRGGSGEHHRAKRSLPTSYDVRSWYPMCKSIDSVRYQYKCSSCWAVTAASLMSDRHCIYNFGTVGQLYFSPLQILSCVSNGCTGGKEWDAYDYWIKNGLVSGGTAYAGANQPAGCLPYPDGMNTTPSSCPVTCSATYTKPFAQDKIKGGQWYIWWNPTVEEIKQEIYSYGPVAAFFTVYEDFFYYKNGVYEYAYGDLVGYHLTKLIGWGTENGVDYWQAINTWGTNWGQGGLFKIRRGNNTVGIEGRITSVLPKEAF